MVPVATARRNRPDAASTTADIDAALAANAADTQPATSARRVRASRRATAPAPTDADATIDVTADVAPDIKPYELKSFTARHVPWMKIGSIGDVALTSADAAERGGLNFDVELLDAGFRSSVKPQPGKSAWHVLPHRKAVVRADNQQFLAYVSKDYPVVQYGDAFAFMDAISPQYVAAGCLGGGRQGFMVVQLPEHKRVELDVDRQAEALDLYVILRTSHDLTRAIEVSVMTLRTVCMNALTLNSFTASARQRWSVKHVGKEPMAKLAVATTTLSHAEAYVESFVRTATELGKIKLEMEEADALLRRILPDRPKRDEQVNAITHAWRESPTNGHPTNGWGLVNAVSEYFEWGRNEGTRTDQSRFTGGLTGSTHRYTNRAAQLLLQRRR